MEFNNEYLKSLHRCPICGELIGCKEEDDIARCSAEVFQDHVLNCRDRSRVKTGRLRYGSDED
jgi:hypothetical protein